MYQIDDSQMEDYMLTKARNSQLEAYIKDCIATKIDTLNTLVIEKKYDKKVWLNQYNIDAYNESRGERISKLAKELKLNIYTLTDEEKGKIGFFLYCDYLKELFVKIEKGKQLVNCELHYVCHWRESEVLNLFGNPLTKEQFETAYSKILQALKEKRNALPTENSEEIANYNKAILDLKGLKGMILKQWDKKINPLDPSVDDRGIITLKLGSPILKSLSKKEKSTTQNLLNPAK